MAKPKNYEKFLNLLKKVPIITDFDVPYFAGYDWSGSKIYVDKDAPRIIKIKGKSINLHMSLAIHEFVEKQHINADYSYAGAHEIAIKYEKQYVKEHGISWKDYDHAVQRLIHLNCISKLESVPKDLDMSPYEYSRDTKAFVQMRRVLRK